MLIYIYIILLQLKLLCYFYCLFLLLMIRFIRKFPSLRSNMNSVSIPTNNLHTTQLSQILTFFFFFCILPFGVRFIWRKSVYISCVWRKIPWPVKSYFFADEIRQPWVFCFLNGVNSSINVLSVEDEMLKLPACGGRVDISSMSSDVITVTCWLVVTPLKFDWASMCQGLVVEMPETWLCGVLQ